MGNNNSNRNNNSSGNRAPAPGPKPPAVTWSRPTTPAAAPKPSGGLSSQVRSAGAVLTKGEATSIAESTGKTVAQVMAKAQEKGVAMGSALVNQFNKGNLGPNLGQYVNGSGASYGVPYGVGIDAKTTQALSSLQALQGLRMQPNTVYAGYSQQGTAQSVGGPQYNPIVLPRGYAGAGGGAGAGGAGGGGANGNVKNDGTIENMKTLYQQQMDAAQAKINEFTNMQAEQINTLTLDFQNQLTAAQSSADQRIGELSDLMLMQQQQSANTQQLLTAQAQAAQVAYEEQLRQAQALSKAYVPTTEQSAASAILGDQRTTTARDQKSNSLSDLAIVSDLGATANPLAGLQLA